MQATRRWARVLCGAAITFAIAVLAHAAPGDSGHDGPSDEDLWREELTAQLVPPDDAPMPPWLRQKLQEMGRRAVSRLLPRLPGVAARMGLPSGEEHVAHRRVLAWWINRYAMATLRLPLEAKQAMLELRYGGEGATCDQFPWTLPNWYHWPPALARAEPAWQQAWLQNYERTLDASIEGVETPERPSLERPDALERMLERAVMPQAPAAWKLPPSLVVALLADKPDMDEEVGCRLMRWWWSQVRSLGVADRATYVDAHFWNDAEQLPAFYMADYEVDSVRAVTGPAAYPGAARWLEIDGATKVRVTLDEDDKPVRAEITGRRHDFSWLGGDSPVIFVRLFDELAIETAMRVAFDPARIRKVDGARVIDLEFEWRLAD